MAGRPLADARHPGAGRWGGEGGEQDHKSLLPVGVKAVQGSFRRGEMVVCVDQGGREVARGLVNYSALEAQKILGQPTDAIEALLGYVDGPELVHRDNLVLV